MDRGDDTSATESVPRTDPRTALGDVRPFAYADAALVAPRPLPAGAFGRPEPITPEPLPPEPPSLDPSPALRDMPKAFSASARSTDATAPDDVFAHVDSEASMRSATALIEELSRSPPVSSTAASPAQELDDRSTPALTAPAPRLSVSYPPAEVRPPVADDVDETSVGTRARRFFKIAAMVVGCWLAAIIVLIAAYRFIDPPVSALMLQKMLTGESVSHDWVPIERMSPNIVRAVIVSEDGRFCEHNGVDYEALQQAVERAANGGTRGASTISMQVVKNLFLWPSKSYVRKAIELPLTYIMELVWPKRRIMEVYLNIAEWGPGIFGIERAAEYHFNKTAARLSPQEAARLAVALPNPIARDAGDPGYGTQRLAGAVLVRARMAPSSQVACVLPRKGF